MVKDGTLPMQGYSGTAGGKDCELCGAGTYKHEIGSGVCNNCVENSNSPAGSVSESDCSCNAGYVRDTETGLCEACPPDSYDAGQSCTTCPDGSVSGEASDSIARCLCNKVHPLP